MVGLSHICTTQNGDDGRRQRPNRLLQATSPSAPRLRSDVSQSDEYGRIVKMKVANCMRLILGFGFLIFSLFCGPANGQTMNEVFQTVGFLQGKGEIERAQIDGVEHEIWLRAPGDKRPHPYRKTTFGTGFFVPKVLRYTSSRLNTWQRILNTK